MPRDTTAGEFVAESLEEEAAKMPPSMKERADLLRDAAKLYRELGGKRNVRVWEEDEWKNRNSNFIKPDPASHS
jgi:hypothetical protein